MNDPVAAPSLLNVIRRIAAELPYRPERLPMTTDDALRQIAVTGSDDAKRLARAEMRRRR